MKQPVIFGLTLLQWAASFMGVGLIGAFVLKLKGPQAWGLFLLAWTLFGMIMLRVFGIQTQLGYYLGLVKDPKEPDVTQGIVFS